MKKRIIALVLTLVLGLSCFGGAAVNAKTGLEGDNMKEMVLLIKNKFGIGDEFTEFNYDYYENGDSNLWYFRWNSRDGKKYISASCDDKGHVKKYSLSSNNEKKSVPEFTKAELLDEAQAFIKQIEPEIADSLIFKSASYYSYESSYRYFFNRIENGIELPDNAVSIRISADGREVMDYSENWNYEVKIPNAKNLISKDEAAAIVKKNIKMKLEYRLGWDNEGKEKVFLAYAPDRTYIAVNAKTGKVFKEKTYWNASDIDMGTDTAAMDEAKTLGIKENGATLSEAEIAKADEIKGIISAEDAIALIKNNDKLLVDENVTDIDTRLTNSDGEYFWRISMEDSRPVDWNSKNPDTYRAYASAVLNARTGEIISFRSSVKDSYYYQEDGNMVPVKLNYTKKECRNIFEGFVKEIIPEKFAATKLGDSHESYIVYRNYDTDEKLYGGYSFNYDRYNENIPFYANNIRGSVDAVTGKIYEFSYNWTDAELPSSKGIIGESRAFDSYIGYDGFDLVYELVSNYKDTDSIYNYTVETKARLVYRTAITPTLVDAFTGKGLSYNGEEYVNTVRNYEYNDIEGTEYERTIRLLGDMGVGFAGESFKPDQVITVGEFKELLNASGNSYYGYYTKYNLTEEETAAEEAENAKKLTRENAAAVIIEVMGASQFAAMDIFKTGYSDEKKISADKLGAVAIVKGFGIMTAKTGKKFMPGAKVTRGEAADIVFKYLISYVNGM